MAEGTQHPITDEGRHLSEAVAEARARGGEGRWLAVPLSSGRWDGNVYDSRAEAVRFTREDATAYLMVPPMPMPPAEATAWIELHRKIWRGGFRFTDPGAPVPVPDLGPMATIPRPGVRPSGIIVPDVAPTRGRRHGGA